MIRITRKVLLRPMRCGKPWSTTRLKLADEVRAGADTIRIRGFAPTRSEQLVEEAAAPGPEGREGRLSLLVGRDGTTSAALQLTLEERDGHTRVRRCDVLEVPVSLPLSEAFAGAPTVPRSCRPEQPGWHPITQTSSTRCSTVRPNPRRLLSAVAQRPAVTATELAAELPISRHRGRRLSALANTAYFDQEGALQSRRSATGSWPAPVMCMDGPR